MMHRRTLLAASIGIALASTLPAVAMEAVTFTDDALAAAQQDGKPILVEISAPWCSTCKAQKPIIGALLGSDKFKGFVHLNIDFDSQKAAVRALRANQQSTLIVFKGAAEVGRLVGVTDPAEIEALLAKAL